MDTTYREFFKRVAERGTPEYAKEYFDHLYNEYLALPPDSAAVMSQHAQEFLQKRQDNTLKWSDVYGFDLMLVELLPLRDLARKAYDMRAKYRSIAGQRDYDAYVASRPPDLPLPSDISKAEKPGEPGESGAASPIFSPPTLPVFSPPALPIFSPPITSPPALPANPLGPATTLEGLRQNLRADVRYLLGQFYLYYALLPYRDGLREEMTRQARKWTFIFLIVFAVILILASFETQLGKLLTLPNFKIPTLLIVVMTGIVGGYVSVLQRIQSAPSEGDAIFNLASLSNGWAGMSISPLYGAVFALLFYMMFTGGIVTGVVFPEVTTSSKAPASQESTQSANKPVSTKTDTGTDNQSPPQPSQTPAATSSPSPTPTPQSAFLRFINETSPTDGKAFALLIVWSFLAGFLERLVPDALNRIAAKTKTIEGPAS
jgi:hypothetical protein